MNRKRKAWEAKEPPANSTRQPARTREPAPSRDQAPRMARKIDLDQCPAGYDPEVWDLTLLFDQLSEDAGIHLPIGRIVLYAQLERRTTELRDVLADEVLRNKRYYHREVPLVRHIWSADGIAKVSSWHELAEAAIRREFSEYVPGDDQAQWFCNRTRFWEMISEVRYRGERKHHRMAADEIEAERQASGYYSEEQQEARWRASSHPVDRERRYQLNAARGQLPPQRAPEPDLTDEEVRANEIEFRQKYLDGSMERELRDKLARAREKMGERN